MTQGAADRVQRYLLDGGDEDLKRLLGLAEAHGEMARTALRRSGIAPGWNVLDCGCGPSAPSCSWRSWSAIPGGSRAST